MRLALATLLLCNAARADDGIRAHTDRVDALSLDPVLRLDPVEGGVTDTQQRTEAGLALGPRARLGAETRVWADGLPLSPDRPQLGWTAAGRYDVELAWGVHLEVDMSLMRLAPQMNGMFGSGMIAGFGAALTKYFAWGLGRVAWISIGVEHTQYWRQGRRRARGYDGRPAHRHDVLAGGVGRRRISLRCQSDSTGATSLRLGARITIAATRSDSRKSRSDRVAPHCATSRMHRAPLY